MSDEKIVLKRLKATLNVLKDKNVIGRIEFQIRDMVEDCIRVIEKQQKEIEELKTNNKILEAISLSFNEIQDRDKHWEDKIKAKIEEFKQVRDEILRNEKEFNRPMMTYDLKRNDYCEKMLQSLLEKE